MAKFLNLVTRGRLKVPKFIILYGVEGVGKTTFASKFPAPMFTGPETSSGFDNVARMPRPKDWPEFLEQLRDLLDPAYTEKTLVIDSLDWLEHMLFDYMKKAEKAKAVEDCGGGFGKWVGVAQRHWLDFLACVDALKHQKKMDVVAIAHYQIKVFNDPLTTLPYDRYMMKLNDKCAAILREAADCVLFANFKNYSTSTDARAKKGRGVSDGARVVYTERRASHDAKNRFSLPEEMTFDFNTIMEKLDASNEDKLKDAQADIEALMLDVTDAEKLAVIKGHYEKNKNNLEALMAMKNRLKVILGEVVDAT
jgi:hypothetical protein